MMTNHCFRSACAGLLALLGSAVASLPAAAQTQDVRPLIERMDRMQRDLDVLQRQLARGGTPAPSSGGATAPAGGFGEGFIAQTDSRFSDLESQMRDMTGRMEELGNQVRQLSERLEKLVGDVDYRLSALERGGAGTPPPASSPPAPGQSGSAAPPPAARSSGQANLNNPQVAPGEARLVLVPGPSGQAQQGAPEPAQAAAAPAASAAQRVSLPAGPPEQQYEYAYGLLLQAQREQSDFTRPEAALKAFVAAHPQHKLAGNAQYWLGETYYVRKDYQNAVVAFADGLKKYPNSEKGADNLLKLGMALGQLNQKPNACGALGELDKRYPNAATAIKQTASRERQRLGCS
jgi:tol-pal system protein YbgF